MTRSLLVGLMSALLASGAAIVGCSDDDSSSGTPSGEGESCTRTADCGKDLVCSNNVCVAGKSGGGDGGGSSKDGGEETASGGQGGSGPVAPVLGGEGESCTRRADCQTGLACLLQVCTSKGATPTADGGSPEPVLGTRGESCQSVRDCADGLTCIPRAGTFAAGGVCDLDEYGLEPTGKMCGGECATANDCCELPPSTALVDPNTNEQIAVKSCAHLVEELLAGDASNCNGTPSSTYDNACFYYKTYCDCAAKTWSCDDAKCHYVPKCEKSGELTKGCPSRTRTGGAALTPATCNLDTNKCEPQTTGCTTTADCEGNPVTDDPTSTCAPNECTCQDKGCYRKCDEDLDCAQGYTCDGTKKVCVPGSACTTDAECAVQAKDVRATCDSKSGKCVLPCSNDHDCSGSGLATGGGAFNGMVCSAKGICEPLGCTSDDECSTGSGVRTYCVDVGEGAAAGIRSAITD